jgi:hypothetical protein
MTLDAKLSRSDKPFQIQVDHVMKEVATYPWRPEGRIRTFKVGPSVHTEATSYFTVENKEALIRYLDNLQWVLDAPRAFVELFLD